MDAYLVTLANGERFVVQGCGDEEDAWACAAQVVADHYVSHGDGATSIKDIDLYIPRIDGAQLDKYRA